MSRRMLLLHLHTGILSIHGQKTLPHSPTTKVQWRPQSLEQKGNWRDTQTGKLHYAAQGGVTMELTEKISTEWKWLVWCVPNHHSMTNYSTTGVEAAKFKGLSMRDLLKGQHVPNPIRAALLRFKRGMQPSVTQHG